jgi:hypothetical protein
MGAVRAARDLITKLSLKASHTYHNSISLAVDYDAGRIEIREMPPYTSISSVFHIASQQVIFLVLLINGLCIQKVLLAIFMM